MMNEHTKLILALMQIDNLISLTEDNEYQKYLYRCLIGVKIELQRQLKLIQNETAQSTG